MLDYDTKTNLIRMAQFLRKCRGDSLFATTDYLGTCRYFQLTLDDLRGCLPDDEDRSPSRMGLDILASLKVAA